MQQASTVLTRLRISLMERSSEFSHEDVLAMSKRAPEILSQVQHTTEEFLQEQQAQGLLIPSRMRRKYVE
jgi:hypothetical protein